VLQGGLKSSVDTRQKFRRIQECYAGALAALPSRAALLFRGYFAVGKSAGPNPAPEIEGLSFPGALLGAKQEQ
jgi:hypothetical protein